MEHKNTAKVMMCLKKDTHFLEELSQNPSTALKRIDISLSPPETEQWKNLASKLKVQRPASSTEAKGSFFGAFALFA